MPKDEFGNHYDPYWYCHHFKSTTNLGDAQTMNEMLDEIKNLRRQVNWLIKEVKGE